METTPNKTRLPGVREEEREITRILVENMPIEWLQQLSVDQVVEKLVQTRIAHCACHGTTDYKDPLNSGLVLQKTGKEGQDTVRNRLTVQIIAELSLPHAFIAYLSACSTAENGGQRLLDEVLHVVSGFEVAGFPHVIGYLWPSLDRACVDSAKAFYKALFSVKKDGWESRDVAWAAREAVMAVRQEGMGILQE